MIVEVVTLLLQFGQITLIGMVPRPVPGPNSKRSWMAVVFLSSGPVVSVRAIVLWFVVSVWTNVPLNVDLFRSSS